MATIRIPSYALDLLPFCQRSEEAGEETCFETFAHLLVTAACLGYRIEEGRARKCESFLKAPAPIDLAIFRSQGLFHQLLILSMMCHRDNEAALDEGNLVTTVEGLAESGLERMCQALASEGQANLPEVLARWIAEPPGFQI